jgi:site-specific DNA-methyltransferase (adenine-specific)
MAGNVRPGEVDITAPATEAAQEWQGWGTALKPAFEPVVVARKPLEGTVAQNVQRYGTGALNIDATRIEGKLEGDPNRFKKTDGGTFVAELRDAPVVRSEGRWPANVVLDETTAPLLDQQSGNSKSPGTYTRTAAAGAVNIYGAGMGDSKAGDVAVNYGDSGGASRFFYVAKAPKRERPVVDGVAHPTVKPLALMRWLVKLVTPPGGVVLDPFEGSGTTLEACLLEGFNHVGIEREADYLPLIMSRIDRQAGTLDVAA